MDEARARRDWDRNRVRPWGARAQRWSATGALIAVWYRLPHRGDVRPNLDRAYLAQRATVGDVDAWNLIANTIRLSIFARRREIEVMKVVAATNRFVRGPFMIEG